MGADLKQRLEALEGVPMWEWPADAAANVLAGLRSAEASIRLVAAKLASEVTDDELARVLLGLVTDDTDAEVAARAAIALGPALETCDITEWDWVDEEDDAPLSREVFEEVVAGLEAVFQDVERPKTVRRRVLETAVRAPRPWHEQAIREAYDSDDTEWQTTAVFAMGFVPGFADQILAAMNSERPAVVYEAVVAAGEQKLDTAGTTVLNIARSDDADANLRVAAIEALAALDPPGAEDLLVELSESDRDDLAEAAIGVLDERELAVSGGYMRVRDPDESGEY